MKVELSRVPGQDYGTLTVTADPDDKKIYSESTLLHQVKKELITQGYDVIKKRMWKDGHMVADTQQYIRTRKMKPDAVNSVAIYDAHYAIRKLDEDYRGDGKVNLVIHYNFF